MNKVILMGRLTRDPDIRYSQGENPQAVARYTLAVDRRFTRDNGDQADFISCVSFGKSAEFAEKYLKQGTKIAVTGRIQTGSYTNRDGQKVYTTDVVVEDQEFAESKAAQDGYSGGQKNDESSGKRNGNGQGKSGNGNRGSRGSSRGNNQGNNIPGPAPADDGFMNIPDGVEDEGLPFN